MPRRRVEGRVATPYNHAEAHAETPDSSATPEQQQLQEEEEELQQRQQTPYHRRRRGRRRRKEARSEREIRIKEQQRAKIRARQQKAKNDELLLMKMKKHGVAVIGPGRKDSIVTPMSTQRSFATIPANALDVALEAIGATSLARPKTGTGSQFIKDDFAALAAADDCQICVVGCPCCWEFEIEEEEVPKGRYDPTNIGSAGKQKMGNRFQLDVPDVGTRIVCDHTDLVNSECLRVWRSQLQRELTICVKTVPSGVELTFGALASFPINYIYFQCRSLCGPSGTDDKMQLLLPTEIGVFHMSIKGQLPTEMRTAYDLGDITLEQWHCSTRQSHVAVWRVPYVHDERTPDLLASFYQRNFTGKRPWETRVHHFMDELPASIPGNDDTQNQASRFIVAAIKEKERWAEQAKEEAARKAKQRAFELAQARHKATIERMKTTTSMAEKEKRRKKRNAIKAERERKLEAARAAKQAEEEAIRREEEEARAAEEAEEAARLAEIARLAEAKRAKTPAEMRRLRKLAKSRARAESRRKKKNEALPPLAAVENAAAPVSTRQLEAFPSFANTASPLTATTTTTTTPPLTATPGAPHRSASGDTNGTMRSRITGRSHGGGNLSHRSAGSHASRRSHRSVSSYTSWQVDAHAVQLTTPPNAPKALTLAQAHSAVAAAFPGPAPQQGSGLEGGGAAGGSGGGGPAEPSITPRL